MRALRPSLIAIVLFQTNFAFATISCESVFPATTPVTALKHSNLLDDDHVPVSVRQKIALGILSKFKGDDVDARLVESVNDKLVFYEDVSPSVELVTSLRQKGTEIAGRDSLELVLKTFRSSEDASLRLSTIKMLAKHSGSDLSTIDLLAAVARGANAVSNAEPAAAADAIIQIHSRLARNLPELILTSRNDERTVGDEETLRALRESRVESIKALGNNNVNATLLIVFKTSEGKQIRGVFKSFKGESTSGLDQILFTREIQAFDFFTEYFSHPNIFVPETIEIVLNHGQSYGPGSLQLFAEGAVTANAFYGKENPATKWEDYGRIWAEQRKDPRWKEIAPWIRVFDWVMGNSDRFPNSQYHAGNPNNLMMKESAGEGSPLVAYLIDNGNGRRPLREEVFGTQDLPAVSEIPEALKQKIRALDDEKVEDMRARYRDALSPAGVSAMVKRLRVLRELVK